MGFNEDFIMKKIYEIPPILINLAIKIFVVILILFISKKVIFCLQKTFVKFLDRTKLDLSIKGFLKSLTRVVCYVLVFLIIANYIGVNSASIVAILGSVGLAIGFALQGSLSNFAGGILILFMKPFNIGDYIITPDVEGKVYMIGIIYTTLLTVDNKKIFIPNGHLSNGVITNVTAKKHRMLEIKVGIGYTSDIKLAKEIMINIYKNNQYIDNDYDIISFVSELGDSSVVIGVRGHCKTGDYLKTKWEILETIKTEFDNANIEIPFNQVDIHLHNA